MVECRKYKLYQLLSQSRVSHDCDTLVGVLSGNMPGKFLKWSATKYIYFSGRCALGPQGSVFSFACVYTSKDVQMGPRAESFPVRLFAKSDRRMLSLNRTGLVRAAYVALDCVLGVSLCKYNNGCGLKLT